ncbi:MAG: asparagine synthase (glutamine-hydrolyzing) [Acidimicrobiia bacterium]
MCGIAGTYNLPLNAEVAEAVSLAIAHRGPDAAGYWNSGDPGPRVWLCHRRLSIIDLSSAANQPFEKDGLILIFNGEIYNYRQLRSELSARGATFRTASDSEVLLEAWRHWGPSSLDRLRGMFAFALYDVDNHRLVLARDHFGIKPLFYQVRNGGLAFASELKALRPMMDEVRVDEAALVASVMYSWVPESHCMFEGTQKLAPGTWLELGRDGQHRVHRYWDPVSAAAAAREAGQRDRFDPSRLGQVMEDSVAAHLVADVPISTFLSGGLDSSLITVMAKQQNAEIDSYTISFRDEDQRYEAMPDDFFYAKKIAAEHGIRLHEVELAPDVADLLPKLVHHLDEPIGDAAAINAYLICQAARDAGVKVLLSGMGADELFGGYRKHHAALLAARYRRMPRWLREKAIEPTIRHLPVASKKRGYRLSRWAHRFVDFASLPEEAAFRRSYTHYDQAQLGELLAPELAGRVDGLIDEHREVYSAYRGEDQVNRMCFTDSQMFLPSLNLAYTDRASMAASTEVRVPFVDKHVFEAAFAIPGSDKIVGRERKAILKEASLPWLPKEIAYRPKGLFSAPLRAWIRRDLQEMVEEYVGRGHMVESGMLDKTAVRSMIDEDRSGMTDRSKEIWQLLTLELWHRQVVNED